VRFRSPPIVQRPSLDPGDDNSLTWKRLFVLSQEGNYARADVIRTLARVLAVVFVVVVGVGVLLWDIRSSQSDAVNQRQEFSSEVLFILCAREGITDPEKQKHIDTICLGYSTPAEARETERDRDG
jgi:hypothetical protein